jgi:hypothetical protein
VAFELNSATGLIGSPEVTDAGIKGRCLLNPKIMIGSSIRINNADLNARNGVPDNDAITTVQAPGGGTLVQRSDLEPPTAYANTDADGFYRVIDIHHFGDTRANEWYTDFTCITINHLENGKVSVDSNAGPAANTGAAQVFTGTR